MIGTITLCMHIREDLTTDTLEAMRQTVEDWATAAFRDGPSYGSCVFDAWVEHGDGTAPPLAGLISSMASLTGDLMDPAAFEAMQARTRRSAEREYANAHALEARLAERTRS